MIVKVEPNVINHTVLTGIDMCFLILILAVLTKDMRAYRMHEDVPFVSRNEISIEEPLNKTPLKLNTLFQINSGFQ